MLNICWLVYLYIFSKYIYKYDWTDQTFLANVFWTRFAILFFFIKYLLCCIDPVTLGKVFHGISCIVDCANVLVCDNCWIHLIYSHVLWDYLVRLASAVLAFLSQYRTLLCIAKA